MEFATHPATNQLIPSVKQAIVDNSNRVYGTYKDLKIPQTAPVQWTTPADEKGEPQHRLLNAQALYTQHCLMCHGVNGAGDGPQAHILNPKPRDFRLGIVKYTSTEVGQKASTDDLQNVIKNGIAGTGMPAFKGLGNHEIAQIVDYVKYLALRGDTERVVSIEAAVDFSEAQASKGNRQDLLEEANRFIEEDMPPIYDEESERLFDIWKKADSPSQIVEPEGLPPAPTESSLAEPSILSIENGRRLYLSKKGQCASCHGETGKGDGEQTTQFHKRPDGSNYEEPGLHDAWGHVVKPRDLTYGVFHGGRRPIDIYRRIYAGVKGTPMPAYGTSGLSEAEIWDLVNYLLYLAGDFPEISQETFSH
ncbi:c-type cytochrome [Rubinisphaera italica]|uniref:c-type cytochrome n=1 Tax=Rubinisphaera italica TaxID=2527969 RepID=UPI0013EF4AB7|nr:cytochrome c [Rubinisphaera italica]